MSNNSVKEGTLYLSSIKSLDEYSNLKYKYFMAKYIKDKTKRVLDKRGYEIFGNLAPSHDLVNTYLSLRKEGKWNKDTFDSMFRPRFEDEIKNCAELKRGLNYVYKMLKSGEDVALLCFCHDYSLCHRLIIGEKFKELGFDVKLS